MAKDTEFKIAIVREAAALNTLVTRTIATGKKYKDMLHVAAISCLVHAAEHGNCDNLNRLYLEMTSNERMALRGSYIRRIHAAIGGLDWSAYDNDNPVPAEVLKSAVEAGTIFGYSDKKGFFVKQDVTPQREAFYSPKGIAETYLIKPDGKVWMRFFERNNVSELSVFGPDMVVAGMNALVKNARGDSDKKESTVPDALVAILVESQKRIEKWITEHPKLADGTTAEEIGETHRRSEAQRKRAAPAEVGAVN
jgi:hypothetical protein